MEKKRFRANGNLLLLRVNKTYYGSWRITISCRKNESQSERSFICRRFAVCIYFRSLKLMRDITFPKTMQKLLPKTFLQCVIFLLFTFNSHLLLFYRKILNNFSRHKYIFSFSVPNIST